MTRRSAHAHRRFTIGRTAFLALLGTTFACVLLGVALASHELPRSGPVVVVALALGLFGVSIARLRDAGHGWWLAIPVLLLPLAALFLAMAHALNCLNLFYFPGIGDGFGSERHRSLCIEGRDWPTMVVSALSVGALLWIALLPRSSRHGAGSHSDDRTG